MSYRSGCVTGQVFGRDICRIYTSPKPTLRSIHTTTTTSNASCPYLDKYHHHHHILHITTSRANYRNYDPYHSNTVRSITPMHDRIFYTIPPTTNTTHQCGIRHTGCHRIASNRNVRNSIITTSSGEFEWSNFEKQLPPNDR